jgi:hypothetical protein
LNYIGEKGPFGTKPKKGYNRTVVTNKTRIMKFILVLLFVISQVVYSQGGLVDVFNPKNLSATVQNGVLVRTVMDEVDEVLITKENINNLKVIGVTKMATKIWVVLSFKDKNSQHRFVSVGDILVAGITIQSINKKTVKLSNGLVFSIR